MKKICCLICIIFLGCLCSIVNGNDKDMVKIPAGSFEMGSNDKDPDEKPVHTVILDSFFMDKYEVTNKEYRKCVDAGVCCPPAELRSPTRESYYGNPIYDDYPVIYVNLDDAKNYCEWKGGRLPTEAEWEYAARGGFSGKHYPWGDSIDLSKANYYMTTGDTTKVGSYLANGYGLYDMSGNVWEWVSDWYDKDYYKISPSQNPKGPENGEYGVLRGGSWNNTSTHYIRVANRSNHSPSSRGTNIGFRCAR